MPILTQGIQFVQCAISTDTADRMSRIVAIDNEGRLWIRITHDSFSEPWKRLPSVGIAEPAD